MGYDRGDSFSFDFEPNGFPFGSKSKGKPSPRSYPIQCERNGNIVFSAVLLVESLHYSQTVREAGVSRHAIGQSMTPLKPLTHQGRLNGTLRGLRGWPLIVGEDIIFQSKDFKSSFH